MVERTPLPPGWVRCIAGDIARVVGGGTPKASDPSNFDSEGHAWLTPADLSGYESMYIDRGARGLSDKGLAGSSAVLMPPGTVLFTSRAPIGYVAIASGPVATNQGFRSFVPSKAINSEFLYWYLRHARPIAEGMASGTTFSELSGSNAAKLLVPVPPLAEQERIAERLKQLDERRRLIQDRLDDVPEQLVVFRQSVLAAAASGRLTAAWRAAHPGLPNPLSTVPIGTDDEILSGFPALPPEWSYYSCVSCCDPDRSLTYGVIKLGGQVDRGVPTLRSSNVRPLSIDLDRVRKIDPALSEGYHRTVLRGGEVLVTVRGTLGGVAVAPPELAGSNVSREVAVVPISPSLNAEYVSYCIASPQSQNWLTGVTMGVAYTGINIRDLKRLPLPIPSRGEQDEIVRRVQVLLRRSREIAVRVATARADLERLLAAALGTAFKGKLVRQEAELAEIEGRSFESAEELLDSLEQAA